nr:prepilin-type N-terminal cleavage/methylation domain-containing protein [Thiospirillum jenense]
MLLASHSRPIRTSQIGFTLVELLIALVLIVIIVVLLFSGLRLGSRAWESVETISDQVSELRFAREFVARSWRSQREVQVTLDDGQRQQVFAGDAQQVEWVAPLSAHVGIPGLYILRLTLETADRDRQRLVLTRWLLHPDVLAGGDGDYPAWTPLALATAEAAGADGDLDQDLAAGGYGRTLLLPDVGEFELAYFGVRSGELAGDTAASWGAEWLEQPHPPQAISLVLTTPSQSWPANVIVLPGAAVQTTATLTNEVSK